MAYVCYSNYNGRIADDKLFLYHFTDVRNLNSIVEHGILSWKTLEERKIDYETQAGTRSHKLDLDKGWDNYVRLSFCKYHPMGLKARKNSNIVILKISPKILIDFSNNKDGVYITNTNAVSKDPRFCYLTNFSCNSESEVNDLFKLKDDDHYIDIPIARSIEIYPWSDDLNSSYKKQQAEVLIKGNVPAEYIVNLADPEEFPL